MDGSKRSVTSVRDVMSSCQCCLRCPPDKHLTTPYIHLGKTEIYSDMLKECFDLQMILGDGEYGICKECVSRLRDASDFKLQVQRSQMELQALLVKDEPIERSDLEIDVQGVLDEVPIQYELIKPEELDDDIMIDQDLIVDPPLEDFGLASQIYIKTESPLIQKLQSKQKAKLNTDTWNGIKYECNDCGQSYRSKSDLKKHIENIHALSDNINHDFTCDFCDATFKIKLFAIEHEKNEHGVNSLPKYRNGKVAKKRSRSIKNKYKFKKNKKKRFKCSDCEYRTNNPMYFKKHRVGHTGEKLYQCDYCGARFTCKSTLVGHIRTHSSEKPFKCNICTFASSCPSYLARHLKIHVMKWKCEFCDYVTNVRSNLTKHRTTHKGERVYQCSFCDLKFALRDTLKMHIRTHTSDNAYLCDFCSYSCKQPSSLNRHLKTHTKNRWKCEFCDFKCGAWSEFTAHKATHPKETPYKCNLCSYAARFPATIKKHLEKHPENKNARKRYKCDLCDFISVDKKYLKYHRMRHTGEKPYKCDQCDFATNHAANLCKHKKYHGVKALTCDKCGYRCHRKWDMVYHMTRHASEQYRCEYCKYTTAFKLRIDRHLTSKNHIRRVEGKSRPKPKKKSAKPRTKGESSK